MNFQTPDITQGSNGNTLGAQFSVTILKLSFSLKEISVAAIAQHCWSSSIKFLTTLIVFKLY